MGENKELMPCDLPTWVQDAEKQLADGKTVNLPDRQEITIKFARGLVGVPFTSKQGVELVKIKIPNRDPDDHTPWESFVLGSGQVHEDKFGGKALWAKIPKDGHTILIRSFLKGQDEQGKKIWETQSRTVSNTELKELVEFYKTRGREDKER